MDKRLICYQHSKVDEEGCVCIPEDIRRVYQLGSKIKVSTEWDARDGARIVPLYRKTKYYPYSFIFCNVDNDGRFVVPDFVMKVMNLHKGSEVYFKSLYDCFCGGWTIIMFNTKTPYLED